MSELHKTMGEFHRARCAELWEKRFINDLNRPSFFIKTMTPEEIEINKLKGIELKEKELEKRRVMIKNISNIFWDNLMERNPDLVQYIEKYTAADIYINRSLSIALKNYKKALYKKLMDEHGYEASQLLDYSELEGEDYE